MFLFDTDHVDILQRQTPGLCHAIEARISALSSRAFYVSIVSFHEQVAGWQSYLNRRRGPIQVVRGYMELSQLLRDYFAVRLINFDDLASQQFELLRRQGVRIGTMDLRIASIALVNDYTVLTRNLVDFEKVPGLKVEDWTVAVPEKPR